MFNADVADMPFLGGEAGDIGFILLVADDETVIPAVGMEPFALLRSLKTGSSLRSDVKGETEMMLAAAGLRHRTERPGPGFGTAQAVVLHIAPDLVVQELLLVRDAAVGGVDLPVFDAVVPGGLQHGFQGFGGPADGLAVLVLHVDDGGVQHIGEEHQVRRDEILRYGIILVDQDREGIREDVRFLRAGGAGQGKQKRQHHGAAERTQRAGQCFPHGITSSSADGRDLFPGIISQRVQPVQTGLPFMKTGENRALFPARGKRRSRAPGRRLSGPAFRLLSGLLCDRIQAA